LTMCAITFATTLLIFMLSFQFGNYQTIIRAMVKLRTGHLQVQAERYLEKRDIRMVVPDPAKISRLLDGMSGVTAYTYRANNFSLVSSKERTYGVLVTGIDPREAQVSSLPRIVRKGQYLSPGDGNQALIGSILAKNLQVDTGDELALLGQGRDGSIAATIVKVKGIISSGQDDFDRLSVYIPLPFFQDTYSMAGAVHAMVVNVDSLSHVPRIKEALNAVIRSLPGEGGLRVLDWNELLPGLMQAIKIDLYSGFIFYLILVVVTAFSILNTFLMAIFERKREFGVMMALGGTPGRLTRLLLLESIFMTGLGSLLGILLGSLVTWYFQSYGLHIPGLDEIARYYGMPERVFPDLSIFSVAIGGGLVLVISFLTALFPTLRIRRLRPVPAMAGR